MPMLMLIRSWDHENCTSGNEERTMVLASIVEMAHHLQAWLPLLV